MGIFTYIDGNELMHFYFKKKNSTYENMLKIGERINFYLCSIGYLKQSLSFRLLLTLFKFQ